MIAFDLDPGPAGHIVECCGVARLLRGPVRAPGAGELRQDLGSGMQVYVPLNTPVSYTETKPFARGVAQAARKPRPEGDSIVSVMKKTAARRQGADRLEPERRPQDDRLRLLAARP